MLKDSQLLRELKQLHVEVDMLSTRIDKIVDEVMRRQPDYNAHGLMTCFSCGAQYLYPVGSCGQCHTSFVE